MKILYISDRRKGGIKNHVQCLRQSLPEGIEHYTIGEDEPFAGTSGHSFAEWKQIRRVIKTFKPDVIHLHILTFWMCLYIKLFVRVPCFVSLHMPGDVKLPFKIRILHWLIKPAYYLPVSNVTWEEFKKWFKGVIGEPFFNPIQIPDHVEHEKMLTICKGKSEGVVAGLIGRWAEEKDWPSFAKVTSLLSQKLPQVTFWGVGVTQEDAISSLGELANHIEWKGFQTNGREWTAKMDLFILTSKHEELPTVVLEAFLMKTAICGYIPRGGMTDILSFSNGALKEVFIEERNPEKLAAIAQRLLEDGDFRQCVIEDGWKIVTQHFDAKKNCKKLVEIYKTKH